LLRNHYQCSTAWQLALVLVHACFVSRINTGGSERNFILKLRQHERALDRSVRNLLLPSPEAPPIDSTGDPEFCRTPFRWLRVALVTYRLYLAKGRHKPGWKLLRQTIVVSFTAAVPIFVVSCCLVSGNLILGTWFNSLIDKLFRMLRNFSPVHWLFLAFFATVALGFVWPGRRRIRPPLPLSSQLSLPDFASPVWINGMRVTIWLMNALFLLANTVDALFLWLRSQPPAGVTYSDFVHHGTNSLIFVTIWSALIIILIVEGFSSQARDLRIAALVWIGQNIILIFGVFRRLKLYVDAYNLTLLRLDVALFLLLVLTGFLLLVVYGLQRRTFGWLCGSGCIALFSLF
jgi:hypothetical protein